MTDLRLVIFDVDGTLVDSQAEIVGAMAEAFAAECLPAPDRAAILSIVGLSLPEGYRALCPDADDVLRDRLAGHYRAAFRDHATADLQRRSPLFPGALDAIHRLVMSTKKTRSLFLRPRPSMHSTRMRTRC